MESDTSIAAADTLQSYYFGLSPTHPSQHPLAELERIYGDRFEKIGASSLRTLLSFVTICSDPYYGDKLIELYLPELEAAKELVRQMDAATLNRMILFLTDQLSARGFFDNISRTE